MRRLFRFLFIAVIIAITYNESNIEFERDYNPKTDYGYATYSNNLNGVWDIKFGEEREEVITQILQKKDVRVWNHHKLGTAFLGGNFAGHNLLRTMSFFYREKMYHMVFVFEPAYSKLLTEYVGIQKDLVKRFGKPDYEAYDFSPPYVKGDGNEIPAVASNRGKIRSSWSFKNNKEILLYISKDLEIKLNYYDRKIYKISEASRENLLDI
jgi:hypothetical protein